MLLLLNGNDYPTDYFRAPLDIPLVLSGTFGEPRPNHFHSGLDIKTNKTTGLKVYAVGPGYVSRIKVSTYGYGNAIYISHPNGYTSVYGHLEHFNTAIDKYVKKMQYQRERFSIELYPGKELFPVKKSQVIAYSGNSGGSSAPHLHFELRDAKSEVPINPLLFKLKVADHIAPIIKSLAIYPINKGHQIMDPILLNASQSGKQFKLTADTIFVNSPQAVLGISTYDQLDGSENNNGVYSISLFKEDQNIFSFQMDKIAFHHTRYANSHIDYREKKLSGDTFHKCFLLPGNKLPIYDQVVKKGVVDLSNDQPVKIRILVRDFENNTSELNFYVQSIPASGNNGNMNKNITKTFYYQVANSFHDSEISLNFTANSFYDTLQFKYSKYDTTGYEYSAIHKVHTWHEPLHKYFHIAIKTKNLPVGLRKKAIIVYRDGNMNISSCGGTWSEGYVKARVRKFGDYYVAVDTTTPRIRPLNISDNSHLQNRTSIRIKITDDLSGIKSYRATVDGNWLLMEYDYKKNLLLYKFDEKVSKGVHNFKLVVNDDVGNTAEILLKFTR